MASIDCQNQVPWERASARLRVIETIDGKRIIERLEEIDNSSKIYRYAMLSGLQATDYTGTLSVTPKGAGSSVQWRVQYLGRWPARHSS